MSNEERLKKALRKLVRACITSIGTIKAPTSKQLNAAIATFNTLEKK